MNLQSILAIALMAGTASAQLFDYTAPATGSDKCALINVVMDESGSMGGDQTFMANTALPTMARELYSAEYSYDTVFVCSTGFTDYYGTANNYQPRSLGCTTMTSAGGYTDSNVVNWILTGGFEDGWHALDYAMDTVPASIDGTSLLSQCSSIDKNLILVTDEDRDVYSADTAAGIKQDIYNKGYVLNAVVNIVIDTNAANLGMKINANKMDSTIYTADASATDGYVNATRNGELYTSYVSAFVTTHADYSTLIVGTRGAVWSINSLRNSGYAATFAKAFTDVKVQEISTGTGGPSG
ncbi:MAG: hypothetical protein SGBAC_012644, partial [Bacillariaceae sp.]